MSRCLRAERPLRRPAPRTGAATYTYGGGSAQSKNSDAVQVGRGIQTVRWFEARERLQNDDKQNTDRAHLRPRSFQMLLPLPLLALQLLSVAHPIGGCD